MPCARQAPLTAPRAHLLVPAQDVFNRLAARERLVDLHRRTTGVRKHCASCVWRGVAWRGVVWRGVAWRGVAWRGVAWRGVGRATGAPAGECACVRSVWPPPLLLRRTPPPPAHTGASRCGTPPTNTPPPPHTHTPPHPTHNRHTRARGHTCVHALALQRLHQDVTALACPAGKAVHPARRAWRCVRQQHSSRGTGAAVWALGALREASPPPPTWGAGCAGMR
jgi:hypothetical protein